MSKEEALALAKGLVNPESYRVVFNPKVTHAGQVWATVDLHQNDGRPDCDTRNWECRVYLRPSAAIVTGAGGGEYYLSSKGWRRVSHTHTTHNPAPTTARGLRRQARKQRPWEHI